MLTLAGILVMLSFTKLTGFLWLYAPYILAIALLYIPFLLEKSRKVLGFHYENFEESMLFVFGICVIIFPLFYLVSVKFGYIVGFRVRPGIPDKFFESVLFHIFAAAIPEELFFRGYLQGSFNQIFPKKFKFLGIEFGLGLILANVLFALSHLVSYLNPTRLAVIIPGFAFGYLREKYSQVFAPAAFHAMSNIFMEILVGGR